MPNIKGVQNLSIFEVKIIFFMKKYGSTNLDKTGGESKTVQFLNLNCFDETSSGTFFFEILLS